MQKIRPSILTLASC